MKTSRVMSVFAPILLLPVFFSVVAGCAKEETNDRSSTSALQLTSTANAATPAVQLAADVIGNSATETATTPVTLASLKKEVVEKGYGDISGQIIFDGDIPKRVLIIAKNANVKNAAVCAANDLFSDELLVDPETKGVANVFVYIYHLKAEGMKIHPDLQNSKKKQIVFDQKGCRFIPHVMVVRTDQTVIIKSGDNCGHNTHVTVLFNEEFNSFIPANDRVGVKLPLKAPESLPMPVKCGLHPWMKAHWLIINHPYATVTDKQGRFKIEKLPVGKVEFRIWHERQGYIDRKYVVNVKEGKTKLDPVKVPASNFE
jgi:hypothetical protein